MANLRKTAEKYLKASFELCLRQMKEHYLVSRANGSRVPTAAPFAQAVDPKLFPDYARIISSPMDINKMEKKLSSGKYRLVEAADLAEPIIAVLADMDLIRENCYQFNPGQDNIEIRAMVDAIRNYFRYLLRVALRLLTASSSDLSALVLGPSTPASAPPSVSGMQVAEFTQEPDAEDVSTFLTADKRAVEPLLGDLLKILRPLGNVPDAAQMAGIVAVRTKRVAVMKVKEEAVLPVKQQRKRKLTASSATVPAPTALGPGPGHGPAGAVGMDEDDMEALFRDDASPVPAPAPKRSTTGHIKKRKTSSAPVPLTPVSAAPVTPGSFDVDAFFEIEEDEPIEQSVPEVIQEEDATASWQTAAAHVFHTLSKHAYVDLSRTSTCIANFYVPVIAANPGLASAYLAVVEKPMDLSTLAADLDAGAIADAQGFLKRLTSIFTNAVSFNQSQGNAFAVEMADRCELLVKYVRWLGYESLPLNDETGRAQCRAEREGILQYPIAGMEQNAFSECKKLLKDLERCRNSAERKLLPFFLEPVNEQIVTDYTVYIRHPADLSSIKYRLDGTLPSDSHTNKLINKLLPRYVTYADFVTDLRRVFVNAQTYNAVHLSTDSTGMSKVIFDAAAMYQERLEGLLPKFTLTLAERIQRQQLTSQAQQKIREAAKLKALAEEKEYEAIEKKIIDNIKLTDSAFAAEYDLEKKQKETEQQYQQEVLATRKAYILQAATAIASSTSSMALAAAAGRSNEEDMVLQQQEEDASSMAVLGLEPLFVGGAQASDPIRDQLQAAGQATLLLNGYGVGGQVPKRLQHQVAAKQLMRRKAWLAWPDDLHHAVAVAPTAAPTAPAGSG